MQRKLELIGKVVSGLGRGAYFVGLDIYRNFFQSLLGKNVYEGTLNIELTGLTWKQINFKEYKPDSGYGGILYCLAKLIDGERIIVIRPEKSRHKENIIEIVSCENLRKKYNLHDGDLVRLIIED